MDARGALLMLFVVLAGLTGDFFGLFKLLLLPGVAPSINASETLIFFGNLLLGFIYS